MKKQVSKLPTVKSLESKVWLECKRIIRKLYGNKCISCGKPAEGKSLHTGHLFRKRFLPLQMKYDLRLLRPQCVYCNLRMKGNEAWYAVNLLRSEGPDYLLDIADDIKMFKDEPLDVKQKRVLLLSTLEKYKQL